MLLKSRNSQTLHGDRLRLVVTFAVLLASSSSAWAQDTGSSWVFIPTDSLDTSAFWSQFWAIINWFEPLALPLIGLAIATVVIARFIKNAFSGGS